MSALKVISITKRLSGTHKIFIISQPTSVNIKPIDAVGSVESVVNDVRVEPIIPLKKIVKGAAVKPNI